jgi:SHS2 domain-containing protein
VPPDRGYEIIEHTADVGLRVWAPDPGALFEQAAYGLIAIMGEGTGEPSLREEIALDAPDGVALLVDWLSEVLFLFDARELVPLKVEAEVSVGPWRVRAVLHGTDGSNFEQHGPAVKAITYHDAMVRETNNGSEARVYLDV